MTNNWRDYVACAGADPYWFFPAKTGPGHVTQALAICRTCPVRDECLEHALNRPEHFGVWGGKTSDERKELRRARRLRTQRQQGSCGTPAGYAAHRSRNEAACPACLAARRSQRHARYGPPRKRGPKPLGVGA